MCFMFGECAEGSAVKSFDVKVYMEAAAVFHLPVKGEPGPPACQWCGTGAHSAKIVCTTGSASIRSNFQRL